MKAYQEQACHFLSYILVPARKNYKEKSSNVSFILLLSHALCMLQSLVKIGLIPLCINKGKLCHGDMNIQAFLIVIFIFAAKKTTVTIIIF